MWTEASRDRVAEIERNTKRYPSDLTDEEWERIAPLMPAPGRRGRPREVDFREVINAVRYLVRARGGCFRSTSGRGKRSTAGSANWRAGSYS
jgi:transposase